MGKLREWAQQAAGAPPTSYEPHVLYPWAGIMHNVDPGGGYAVKADGTGTVTVGSAPTAFASYFEDFFGLDEDGVFNVATELYSLRRDGEGSVFQNVVAIDPSSEISRINEALDQMQTNVTNYGNTTNLPEAVQTALAQADLLLPDDDIDTVIAAVEARALTDHLAGVSRMLSGIWEAGGIISTHTLNAMAILEDGHQRSVTAETTKLRAARRETRSRIALQLVDRASAQQDQKVMLSQAYLAAALDVMKYSLTAKQDQLAMQVEYDLADRMWDLDLLKEALSANSAIYGAQVVPRAQTKGERLLAALSGSMSMGIQGGMAMGSPEAGLALGGVNFLSQMLLT